MRTTQFPTVPYQPLRPLVRRERKRSIDGYLGDRVGDDRDADPRNDGHTEKQPAHYRYDTRNQQQPAPPDHVAWVSFHCE